MLLQKRTEVCRKCKKDFPVSENYTGKFPLCNECRKTYKPTKPAVKKEEQQGK